MQRGSPCFAHLAAHSGHVGSFKNCGWTTGPKLGSTESEPLEMEPDTSVLQKHARGF